jgi:hypothetical protein
MRCPVKGQFIPPSLVVVYPGVCYLCVITSEMRMTKESREFETRPKRVLWFSLGRVSPYDTYRSLKCRFSSRE